MKKFFLVILVLACFAAFTADLFALTPSPKPPKTAKVERFTGGVTSVNISDMTMVVQSENSGMTFDLGASRFKGYKSIHSIKKGDRVTVQYVMKQGKAIARIVSRSKP